MGVYLPGENFATQGPAPDGFHVPLKDEWVALCGILTTTFGLASNGTTMETYLKLPFAGNRNRSAASVINQGTEGRYWSSSRSGSNYAYCLTFNSSTLNPKNTNYRADGFSVRCFKNKPTVPTSSWTKLYGTSIESGGIFWSNTDGLISLSSDGQTWITIQDKNLGATTVWNSGDTLSETNCGGYFQWGNNYMFPFTGTIANQSTTQVDASNYGPGNYYSSDTFIKYSGRWDSTDNGNLWGGIDGNVPTNVPTMTELKNAYIGEYRVPGANTLAYYPLTSTSTVNDMKGSGTAYNLTNNGDVTFGTYDGISCAKFGGTQNTSCLYYNSSLFTGSAEFTANIWHKQLSTYSGWHNNILSVGTYNGTNGFIEWVRINDVHLFVGGWTNDRDTGYVMPVGTWQNIVYTHKNGTIKVYVDGVLKYTGAVSFAIGNGKTILGGGIVSGNISVDNMQGYLSNVIFESVEWTAQKITDYYNLTKSEYGL